MVDLRLCDTTFGARSPRPHRLAFSQRPTRVLPGDRKRTLTIWNPHY